MGELLELPLLLSQLLLEDMLVLVGMLPTLLVLSMLPSVRLRLSQRLRLMLVFSMELTAIVLVLVIPVLDMLDMEDMVLAMAVSAMLVLATMARDLLMLNPRLMLVCIMEDMDMVLVLDMLDSDMDTPVLDMLDMADTDLDMEDTVLDMAVVSTMVKQLFIQQKLKSNLFVIQCPLDG